MAKIEDLIILTDKKKLIREYTKLLLVLIINILSKKKRFCNDQFIVTHYLILITSPEAYTHIRICVTVWSERIIKFLWIVCFIPFAFLKNSFIIQQIIFCYNTCCCKVMLICCFLIKFSSNDIVTVTLRTNTLSIPTV